MIKTLKLSNFTVFKEAELEFSPGLNVIVGENGTGKSHLLKLAYTILRTEFEEEYTRNDPETYFIQDLDKKMYGVFGRRSSSCIRKGAKTSLTIDVTWGNVGKNIITISKEEDRISLETRRHTYERPRPSVFIPPKEILSIYPGFRAAIKSRELEFDATYEDLADALDAVPYRDEKLEDVAEIVALLEKTLRAKPIRDSYGNFYFVPRDTPHEDIRLKRFDGIHAQMAAEGHRKLGMLTYLIKNGSLKKGSSLFWDEPEANLNPKLLSILARVLVDMSNFMQITIATHSLFLLRELEIMQEMNRLNTARYFGLHLGRYGTIIEQGNDSSSIGDIAALDMSIEQADRYLRLN